MLQLETRVKDRLTGATGKIVGRSEHLFCAPQYEVLPDASNTLERGFGAANIWCVEDRLEAVTTDSAAGAVAAPSADASIIVPAIGADWPCQGGAYAGIIRNARTGVERHLILATQAGTTETSQTWGPTDIRMGDATDPTDGAANTRTLLASGHEHPAARYTSSLQIDGHTDFYLPARRELSLLEVNLAHLMAPEWHWSSTQNAYDDGYAWCQHFGNGYQDYYHKSNSYRVRPVRSFLVIR